MNRRKALRAMAGLAGAALLPRLPKMPMVKDQTDRAAGASDEEQIFAIALSLRKEFRGGTIIVDPKERRILITGCLSSLAEGPVDLRHRSPPKGWGYALCGNTFVNEPLCDLQRRSPPATVLGRCEVWVDDGNGNRVPKNYLSPPEGVTPAPGFHTFRYNWKFGD